MGNAKNVVIVALALVCGFLITKPYLSNISTVKSQAPVNASQPVKVVEAPRVISVTPEYATKQQLKKICSATASTQMVENQDRGFKTGMGIGAVAGGASGAVLGQQVAGSPGAIVGAVVGLVGGGISGAFIQHANSPSEVAKPTTSVTCSSVYVPKQYVTGYNVTYSYDGTEGVVFMKHRPKGNHLPIFMINA